ncbi:MAG: T9SS type A sorting domain-containing protein [Bacteroidales bacterium]|nr:T9SS type A sorting domain-containing protein [Bacteroidales bacterium]
MRTLFFYMALLVAGTSAFAQEALTGLHFNPVVQEKVTEMSRLKYAPGGTDTLPVNLPFFDDFSTNGVFPSALRWIDRYAFENNDFPVYPVNLGAVTLDAINDSGMIYRNAVPGPACFIADHLTSRYIRLDSILTPVPRSLGPADSVYLSFFYQPQGRGRPPQTSDSLILQFLVRPAHDSITPTDTTAIPDLWQKVWFANGMSLDTFYLQGNKYFRQVMVPVTDPRYFTNKFRFRFFNYVSLASSEEPSWQSNTDQWNLDNIYLNINREYTDTIYPEIRFIQRPPSMLKRYEQMPYPQYCDDPTNEISDTIDILISNRDLDSHLSSYNYYATDPGGAFSKTYDGGNYNIKTFYYNGYVTYQPFAHPPVPFLFPISASDSASFLITHIVKANDPGSALGDTMQSWQKFYNYFAYDDGTPEAGYGLTPAGSKLAYRFHLNKSPDTLRAVQVYFNRTLSNASNQWFYLCVWNDNAGTPGDTIYSDLVLPYYTDSLNKFITYHIYPPLRLTGTFYVGWIQTTNDNLNVGFDTYNNSQDEIFYNTMGEWDNSFFSGSLMMRPVVGKPIPLGTGEINPDRLEFGLYPNPCFSGKVNIRLPENDLIRAASRHASLTIYNLIGQPVLKSAYTSSLDVANLPDGIYCISLTDHDGTQIGTSKLIIAH